MAYQVPLDQPLTETQAELIAKIGSMKNLMSLNFLNKFKISKGEQISTFDYILKAMKAMGIDPVILLQAFLNSFFDTDKLVEFILRGAAQLATGVNVNLNPNSTTTLSTNPSKAEKKNLTTINYNFLNSNSTIKDALRTVVNALKMQMIKDLMTLIFGNPKKQSGKDVMSENQDTSYDRLKELVSEVYCGTEIYSVSSPANVRNEDLEYNRIQIKERANQGKAFFKVTCEGVNISFPDNPEYLFSDAPPGVVSSNPTTASQALINCINHVANQTQKAAHGGGQGTSSTNKKDFVQMLVEKLIVHITTLLKPFFIGIVAPIPGVSGPLGAGYDGLLAEVVTMLQAQGRSAEANLFNDIYPPPSCDILGWGSDSNGWTPDQKRKSLLITILCNMALNTAIGFLVSYLIKEVKKFIVKYLANRAVNKAKRKQDKIAQRYTGGKSEAIQKNATKAKKQAVFFQVITPAINVSENTYV
jgi:hypothetical protein